MSRRETTPGDVYRAAARMLERGEEEFPCLAVGFCSPSRDAQHWYFNETLAGRFILAMAPGKKRHVFTSDASHDYIYAICGNEERFAAHSILALCFAAAMADTGDLP